MTRLRQSPYLLPAGLGLLVLAVYLLSGSSDLKNNGDTDLRYQTTQSIVDHVRLWIAGPWWTDSRVSHGIGGHFYAFYGPGQTVLMIPLYILGKAAAHHLGLPYDIATLYAARSIDLWLGAVLAVMFYFFALAVGYGRRVAAILTLIFAFATAAWPDAQSALEQTPVELFLVIASYAVWRWLRRGMQARRPLVIAGCAVGAAMCTRYDAGLYVAVIPALVFGFRARAEGPIQGLRSAGVLILAVLPWLLALLGWNYARFGNPFLTGLTEQTFGGNPVSGLLGLTVSPGKGLFWYIPLLLLLPWACWSFVRRTGRPAALFGAMALTPLIFYSTILFWHGDPSWGPRYLYIGLPYLIMPLGEILSGWRSRARALRLAMVVLVAMSLGIQVAAVSVTQWRFWYHLEADQQTSVSASSWTGQPFRWGATHYHYYWNVRQSPLLIQIKDVYQVARLSLGATSYRLTVKPDPFVSSNTADNYPLNTFAFWWTDSVHPLLGPKARDALALSLGLTALASAWLIASSVGVRRRPVSKQLSQGPPTVASVNS